ncbi:MAG: ribose-phosphate pyrophosphokinase, partial [Candidatus Levybacteria bacterium CG22_combo_CG10-13_8_21_14_all_35_11]
YIIQSGQPNPNDRVIETALMVDAADRASAKEITVIFSYFPYSRKDRKDESRVPISAAVMAKTLKNCGAKRILTIDLHAEQEQGFVDGPWDNLYSSYVLIPKIKEYVDNSVVVASPDAGGVPRVNFYAKMLRTTDIAVVPKIRNPQEGNVATSLGVLGNVKDRNVLLVDDIIDSAGTLVKAAVKLKTAGARSIIVAAPHALFSGKALENIANSPIEKILTTNSIEQKEKVLENPLVEVVSIAPLITSAICRVQSARSLDQLIIDTNGKNH